MLSVLLTDAISKKSWTYSLIFNLVSVLSSPLVFPLISFLNTFTDYYNRLTLNFLHSLNFRQKTCSCQSEPRDVAFTDSRKKSDLVASL